MGTGEQGPPARRENGLKRRRWVDEEDDDDEEYVAEEEEEEDEEDYVKELAASSASEGGKDSDEEYDGEEEEEEGEYEVETPRPKRPVKGGRKGKTDPAAARSKRRRYEEDDDYEDELDEDEEYHEEEEEATPRPKSLTKFSRRDWNVELDRPAERSQRRRQEDDSDFDPELDDEDFDPELDDVEDEEEEVVPSRPKSQAKCSGLDRSVELAVPAERSHRQRQEEDSDFDPELDDDDFDPELEDEEEEEVVPPQPKCQVKCGGRDRNGELAVPAERSHRQRQDEDMDFDPELDDEVDDDFDFDPELDDDDEDEFADEEEEEVGAICARKVTVKNPVKRKSVAKRGSLKKKKKKSSGSKASRTKSSSGKKKKSAPLRRRRKRLVSEDYDEEDDFIVEDEVVTNRHPKKKARTGTGLDSSVSAIDEETWPNVDSDTSDFDFVTSDEEPDSVEPTMLEPIKAKKRRKKRATVSDSSSDSEFIVSDKELEDLRETEPPKILPALLAPTRRISVTRHAEDKGKQKQEPEEALKPICGICLSEDQRATVQGVLNCCSHYFCFACIMEWSRVESRCPLCKQRFTTITKASKLDLGLGVRKSVIKVEERDQVYQPSEEEIRRWLDPYENVVCIECNQGGDDSLMLLCDICDSSAHTFCVGLGREVPEGNWYCGGCRLSDEGPSYTRTQHTSGYERHNHRNHDGSSVGFGMAAQSRTFERLSSINSHRSLQGIDLNLSPREAPGENHSAESQASADGASTPGMRGTVSGRRQIHRYIRILLTRPRPPTSTVQPRTEPHHHNFLSSEANTSQIMPDSVQNQQNGIPFVQQIEGVKSNLKNV